jgi:hypothetical protein
LPLAAIFIIIPPLCYGIILSDRLVSMGAFRITAGLVLAAAVWAAGCTSSHWASRPAVDAWPETGSQASWPPGPSDAAPAVPSGEAGETSQADSQALLDVMAEVRRVGALDPAAEAELMENLRQTRPDLWPLVMQQFRAALNYRRQAGQEQAASSDLAASGDASVNCPATPPAAPAAAKAVAAKIEPPQPAARGVSEADSPLSAPRELEQTAGSPKPGAAEAPADEDLVVRASYDERENRSHAHLDEATRILESEVSPSPASAEEIAAHARLRMLYLLSGRRDDALKPIPAVAPGTQDFWSNEFYGLAALLGGASSATPSRLAAEAHRPLDEAAARLAESCPLVLNSLAFVTEVQSYGVFKPFEKYEFAPGQKLLLYAEVNNFKSTETEKGFVTSLKSSYQIFEPGGRRVAEHEFNVNEETCRNRRRDFFIGYEFCLPKRIYSGKHVLKLTVEDVASGKVGESSIEFTVVGE